MIFIAHFEKFSQAQCPQVLCHDYHIPGRNSKNKDIDPNKREQNYNLAPHNLWAYEYLKKRLSEVYCFKRSDVKVMCSWVFTVPKDVKPGDEDKCLQAAYNFLENRYGKENVVSAWVHKDEHKSGRAHIHFNYVPVVYDKKKQRYKVSAKELINRKELCVFHEELEKAVCSELGYHCSVITGELADRPDLSIEHFKSYQETAKSKDTIARLEAYEKTFGFAMDMPDEIQAEFLKAYKNAYDKLENEIEKIHSAELEK